MVNFLKTATVRQLVWFLPLFLIIHNLEEALTMERWFQNDWTVIPRTPYLLEFFLPVSKAQFWLATLLIDVSVLGLVIIYHVIPSRRGLFYLLLGIQSILFLNVFNHLFMVFLFLQYQPGTITSIVLNIPFSIYILFKALRENKVNKPILLVIFALSTLFYPVSAGFFLVISKYLLSGI